jgi:hypothetical protein
VGPASRPAHGLNVHTATFGQFPDRDIFGSRRRDDTHEIVFKDKTATVIYDDAKANVNQLTSATTKAGYPSAPKS